jgi:hypothetical protein
MLWEVKILFISEGFIAKFLLSYVASENMFQIYFYDIGQKSVSIHNIGVLH